jgi:lipoprotein signal peptidase
MLRDPVMLSLPVRLLYIAAVALVLADVDWAAKAWALDQLRPDQLVLNTDRPWHAVMTPPVLAVILVACARTRLLALGAGVIIGGALGNMGEFAVFGRVTDFIPLGVPYRGSTWSPADFILLTGLVLLWIGAAQYPRARALQARDPLHGRRRRARRQGDALPGDS